MGLDTSHDAWHGTYRAFTRWRNQLAQTAGYILYTGEDGYTSPMIDWGHITDEQLLGEWTETPSDPLLVLIAHSDCDGIIASEQAKPLADRIEELLPQLPEGSGGGHIGDWHEKTQKFIDGLRRAAAAGEDLDFH